MFFAKQRKMMTSFILHDWRSGQEIEVDFNEFSYEGSQNQPGSTVWWRDDHGDSRSAFVRETPEEIDEIINQSLKKTKTEIV